MALLPFVSLLMLARSLPTARHLAPRGQRARLVASAGTPDAPASELLSVAPMMEYTDKHFRHMLRLLSRRTVLYTEMVVSNAVHHKRDDPSLLERWYGCTDGLEFGATRDVLQLGGSDAPTLASAARAALSFPYSAINLNCGCPSERVAGAGAFGASLMRNPEHVASLCAAMGDATSGAMPVTVKCRIGVDDEDSYEQLRRFIEVVSAEGGVRHFIVHARKAILNMKLTPHENRVIPPLKPEYVHALVRDYESAGLRFTLNGGIVSLADAAAHLRASPSLAGVMIGRDVVNRPFHYAHADRYLSSVRPLPQGVHGPTNSGAAARGLDLRSNTGERAPSRGEVLAAYARYARAQLREGARETALLKPVHNLFHGSQGARGFRRYLARLQAEQGALQAVLHLEEAAAACVPQEVLDEPADERARDSPESEERRLLAGLPSGGLDDDLREEMESAGDERYAAGQPHRLQPV